MYKHAVDNTGRKFPPSRCYRELDWQIFLDATVPPWLAAVGTVAAESNMTTTQGGILLSTTSTIHNEAYFQLAYDVLVQRFAAIDIRVDGLKFDKDRTNLFDFVLGLSSANNNHGLQIQQIKVDDDSTAQTKGLIQNSGGDLAFPFDHKIVTNLTEDDYTNKSFMLRLLPDERAGEFYEDNELVEYFSSGTTGKYVVDSVIKPRISIITRTAAVRTMKFQRLRIGFWT